MGEERSPVEEFLDATEGLEWLKNYAAKATNESDRALLNQAVDKNFHEVVYPLGTHPEVRDHFLSLGAMLYHNIEQAEQRLQDGEITRAEFEAEYNRTASDHRLQRVALYAIIFTDVLDKLDEPSEIPVTIRTKTASEYRAEVRAAREQQEAKERALWPTMKLDPQGVLSFGDTGITLNGPERLILEGLASSPGEFMTRRALFPEAGYRPTQKAHGPKSEYVRLAAKSLNEKLSFLPGSAAIETKNPGTRWKTYRLAGAKLETGRTAGSNVRLIDHEFEQLRRIIKRDPEKINVTIRGHETTISRGAFRLLAILDRTDTPIFIEALREKMYGTHAISDEQQDRLITHVFEAWDKSWWLLDIISSSHKARIWLNQNIRLWQVMGSGKWSSSGTETWRQLKLRRTAKLDIQLAEQPESRPQENWH